MGLLVGLSVGFEGDGEGVVALWCNPLTLQPEQPGGVGPIPGRIPSLERHDKGSRARLGLLYFCDPSAWRQKTQLHLHLRYTQFALTTGSSCRAAVTCCTSSRQSFWFPANLVALVIAIPINDVIPSVQRAFCVP